jgi:hypothetical protein
MLSRSALRQLVPEPVQSLKVGINLHERRFFPELGKRTGGLSLSAKR